MTPARYINKFQANQSCVVRICLKNKQTNPKPKDHPTSVFVKDELVVLVLRLCNVMLVLPFGAKID